MGLVGLLGASTPWARADASDIQWPGRAPFGLTWGMSIEDVKKLGWMTGESPQTDDRAEVSLRFDREFPPSLGLDTIYPTIPNVPNEIARLYLFFGNGNKLYSVAVESKGGAPDDILARYKDLSSVMTNTYGPGGETVEHQSWLHWDEEIEVGRKFEILAQDVFVIMTYKPAFASPAKYQITYTNRAGYTLFRVDGAKHDLGAF